MIISTHSPVDGFSTNTNKQPKTSSSSTPLHYLRRGLNQTTHLYLIQATFQQCHSSTLDEFFINTTCDLLYTNYSSTSRIYRIDRFFNKTMMHSILDEFFINTAHLPYTVLRQHHPFTLDEFCIRTFRPGKLLWVFIASDN